MTLNSVGLQPVLLYAAPAFGGKDLHCRIMNMDPANPVYLDKTPTVTLTSTPLEPQGTVTYGGNRDVWASSGTFGLVVVVDVDSDALSWTNPAGLRMLGVPPFIPGAESFGNVGMQPSGGSPFTLVAFTAPSRVWFGNLSLSIATDAAYSAGFGSAFARLLISGAPAITLCNCGAVVAGASQTNGDHAEFGPAGILAPAGSSVEVDVNGAVTVPDMNIRAAASCLVTTP